MVIAGPTACGKSALALAVAEAFDGRIINADSMQVYRELSILTARPTPADEARAPHALYGVLPSAEPCSAARWLGLAQVAVAESRRAGRLPLVVGGTGLYLKAMMEGLASIPPVPDEVRTAARAHMAALGPATLHAELAIRDPAMAARLRPGDTQRLVRAWEVLEATGRSLAEWQAEPTQPGIPGRFLVLMLMPERPVLYRACDGRFAAMVKAGALDEVAALDRLGLDSALPAMKALGVPELRRHLHGEIGLGEAIELAQAATRHYAKRQCTWFRHQLPGATALAEQYSESLAIESFSLIRHFLLTGPT